MRFTTFPSIFRGHSKWTVPPSLPVSPTFHSDTSGLSAGVRADRKLERMTASPCGRPGRTHSSERARATSANEPAAYPGDQAAWGTLDTLSAGTSVQRTLPHLYITSHGSAVTTSLTALTTSCSASPSQRDRRARSGAARVGFPASSDVSCLSDAERHTPNVEHRALVAGGTGGNQGPARRRHATTVAPPSPIHTCPPAPC